MSQDPNQQQTGYGSDAENPYGAPVPHEPYGAPQNPYDSQPNPYNPPGNQHGPYNPPPEPHVYQMPPQTGYGEPNQYSSGQYGYGIPPQGVYGAPPAAGYAFSGQGYGNPNQIPLMPLPLSEAIRQLPRQYLYVLLHPSRQTFDAELHKSSWDITWIQLLIMAIGAAIISLIFSLFSTSLTRAITPTTSITPAMTVFTTATSVSAALFQIVLIPAGFFIGVGIQYLLAKAFKGEGTFLVQSYTSLLYNVPIRLISTLITGLLGLIPIVGIFIALPITAIISIYGIVLNVFQIQSSHRLSGGKATWVVLIPYLVAIVLAVLCTIVVVAILGAAIYNMSHSTSGY